jgi:hypothetical protein
VRHRGTLFFNSVDEGVSALNEMNAQEARRVIGGGGIEGLRWAIERPGEGVVAEFF